MFVLLCSLNILTIVVAQEVVYLMMSKLSQLHLLKSEYSFSCHASQSCSECACNSFILNQTWERHVVLNN